MVNGGRILTNAHVVSDSVYIQVKKVGDPKLYDAEISVIGHDCDLATLTVKDHSFFTGTKAMNFGGLPTIQDAVSVYGYPTGGDDVSVTAGVVSRIEIDEYVHSERSLLAIQIDAAINPGNSGGPVFHTGKIIGVAMQGIDDADNIGYIITPCRVSID